MAYVRIPSYSILFSLVEEQRGRDCGKVTTLYMKVTVRTLTSFSKILNDTHSCVSNIIDDARVLCHPITLTALSLSKVLDVAHLSSMTFTILSLK